jgi:hypothetical protein
LPQLCERAAYSRKNIIAALANSKGIQSSTHLEDIAREALGNYVEKLIERSPNVRLIGDEEPDLGNICLRAVCLRKCGYVW